MGVDGIRTFTHDAHAQAGGPDGRLIETDAVVFDLHMNVAAFQIRRISTWVARAYFMMLFRLSWATR